MLGLYPNYYFIGALLVTLFLIYVSILLFRIPQRSSASTHLAFALFTGIFFNLAYVVAQGVYTVPMYATRLMSIYVPMVATLHIAVFFRSFPTVRSAATSRWILIVGHTLILLAIGYMAYVMATSPLYYVFNSHFWDSDSLPAQKYLGYVILASMLHYFFTGLWRGFIEKGAERWGIFAITFGFAFATIPAGILHVLSRDNLIPRSTFMTTTVISNLLGYFIAAVVYINVTKDRTALLGRITGIALLTVLLIFQAVAYYWMNDAERSFDTVMYGRAREGYVLGRLPEKGKAIYIYDYGKQKLFTPVPEEYMKNSAFAMEAQATYLMSELIMLKAGGAEIGSAAQKLISGIAPYSPLQAAYLSEFVAGKNFHSGAELAFAIAGLRNQQLYQIAKLRQMTSSEVRGKMNDMIANVDKKFPGVRKYMETQSANLTNQEKRELLIQALTPWRMQGDRLYRGSIFYDDKFPEHFVAFQFIDPGQKRVIEVAYPYLVYRETIAASGWPLVVTIFAAMVLIIFGFTIFFRGALMKPVEAIIHGLKEINNDNFDARVKIHVEDEIGFMAKSFNKMARSIKAGRMRLQQYAEQLEKKVQERTQELQTTLKDVQALKAQQDGDYFLTTLLLKPLGVNEVNSTLIGIESYVRQKKKFEFRHWSKDIGGDINISHVIELEGKNYIAFINADAMGKSIQGAGGALVLGSVFHTIIERTQATHAMQQLAPERWLKNAFIELHRVFESFDGSMLVSGFFALIDEHTGLMYHILAEHPRAVLYRDGKASFVENDRMLRKLGTSGVEGTLQIATTQLEPGDILIVGSDGRDDLILGYDEHGGRVINEDENLFLTFVEETQANLQGLIQKLETTGEIMDDLSLMRIERFKEERPPSYAYDYSGVLDGVKRDLRNGQTEKAIGRIEAYLKQDAFYPEAVKNLAQIYYQAKNYEKAAYYAQDYLWLKPGDAHFVYFASLCFRRIKDYRKSIDLSERLRLREIPLAKNLALLTDLHVRMGNVKRAEAMLIELIELDPNFGSITLLKEKLEKLKMGAPSGAQV
ncbi:MAG: SpoIIE family protein phosphatase [Leptospiraceae bacterium]|nr:SpoIIE family protein phosphatase [Leptospiraceae bacterium]